MRRIKKCCFCTTIFVLAVLVVFVAHSTAFVTKEEIRILNNAFYIGNSLQNESTVILTAAQEKLYFILPNRGLLSASQYDGYLSVFENGSATRLTKVNEAQVLDWGGRYVFMRENSFPENESRISCFDVIAQNKAELVTVDRIADYRRDTDGCFWSETGVLYIPVDQGCSSYYAMTGMDFTKTTDIPVYCYGDRTYTLLYEGDTLNGIWCESIDEAGYVFRREAGQGIINVFPSENGLVIHCEQYGKLLYYVDGATMDVTELFVVTCDRSESAVNIWGDYAYLSFKRYEKYDHIFPKRYENDKMEGTYRISLIDYSVEKLSDEIYNGLYIFDDTGIYACDENCNIYKLDFDGQRILTLLEKK